MDIQNILVPIDYSLDSQRALHWGASLAEKYGATLLLLTSVEGERTIKAIFLTNYPPATNYKPSQ